MGSMCILTLLFLIFDLSNAVYLAEPHDVSPVRGLDAVHLECLLTEISPTTIVSWTKNDVIISRNYDILPETVTTNELSRYKVIGNALIGQYDLIITNIDFSDEGEYQCIVTNLDGSVVLSRSRTSTLNVIVPPADQPICSIEPNIEPLSTPVQMGQRYVITCRSDTGDPTELLFVDDNDNRPETETTSDDFRTQITSIWTAERFDNPKTFTCIARYPALPFTRSCTLGPFVVQYPPFVYLSTDAPEVEVGESATFTCGVDVNPPVYDYKWLFNGRPLHLDQRENEQDNRFKVQMERNGISILTIKNVFTTDDKSIVSCEARHPLGFERKDITLNVTASVMVRIEYTTIDNGQNTMAIFTCESQSKLPVITHTWYYNGIVVDSSLSKYKVLRNGTFLIITKFHDEDVLATLKCEATNYFTTGYSTIRIDTRNSTLSLRTPSKGLDRVTTIVVTFVAGVFAGVIVLCLVQYIVLTRTKFAKSFVKRIRSSKRGNVKNETVNIQPTVGVNDLNRDNCSRNSTCEETDSLGYILPINEGANNITYDHDVVTSQTNTGRRPYADIRVSTLEPEHNYQKLNTNRHEKGQVAKNVELFEYDLATK